MRWMLAAVIVIALAGCGSTHSRLPAGAIALRALPAQGLMAQERGGVALGDLHGRRLAWLPRFSLYPSAAAAQASLDYGFLSARLYLPLLLGPRGWYRLDVSRQALIRVEGARVPLDGGANAVAKRGQAFTVERGGHVVLHGAVPNFRVLSPRLVQTGTTLSRRHHGAALDSAARLPGSGFPRRRTHRRLRSRPRRGGGGTARARAPRCVRRRPSARVRAGATHPGESVCLVQRAVGRGGRRQRLRRELRLQSHRPAEAARASSTGDPSVSRSTQLLFAARLERGRTARGANHAAALRRAIRATTPSERRLPRRPADARADLRYAHRRRDVELSPIEVLDTA